MFIDSEAAASTSGGEDGVAGDRIGSESDVGSGGNVVGLVDGGRCLPPDSPPRYGRLREKSYTRRRTLPPRSLDVEYSGGSGCGGIGDISCGDTNGSGRAGSGKPNLCCVGPVGDTPGGTRAIPQRPLKQRGRVPRLDRRHQVAEAFIDDEAAASSSGGEDGVAGDRIGSESDVGSDGNVLGLVDESPSFPPDSRPRYRRLRKKRRKTRPVVGPDADDYLLVSDALVSDGLRCDSAAHTSCDEHAGGGSDAPDDPVEVLVNVGPGAQALDPKQQSEASGSHSWKRRKIVMVHGESPTETSIACPRLLLLLIRYTS